MGLHKRPAHRASVFGPEAWVPTLASVFRGAPLPTRVSAGPVGDIIHSSPPGLAGAMLARSRGPRAPALRYLHTLRQDCLFD